MVQRQAVVSKRLLGGGRGRTLEGDGDVMQVDPRVGVQEDGDGGNAMSRADGRAPL